MSLNFNLFTRNERRQNLKMYIYFRQKIVLNISCNPFNSAIPITDAYANSVDPDKTARNKPSHQDLHCLLLFFLD